MFNETSIRIEGNISYGSVDANGAIHGVVSCKRRNPHQKTGNPLYQKLDIYVDGEAAEVWKENDLKFKDRVIMSGYISTRMKDSGYKKKGSVYFHIDALKVVEKASNEMSHQNEQEQIVRVTKRPQRVSGLTSVTEELINSFDDIIGG